MIPDQENIVAPVVVQEKATRERDSSSHQQARTNVCARRTRLLTNRTGPFIFVSLDPSTALIM
jgi:hypothetical protein